MRGSEFEARRAVKSYRQTIDKPPDVVFPLLCPVREAEWLEGWQHKMIYSVSGLVEEGAVFSTANAGEEITVWVVTKHDPTRRLVEFTRFTPASRTCVLKIGVEPFGSERSHVDITYTYTSIAPQGNQFLSAWSDESFLEAVTFWERSMNHFLRTGGKLRRADG
jgi:hypothetical protein